MSLEENFRWELWGRCVHSELKNPFCSKSHLPAGAELMCQVSEEAAGLPERGWKCDPGGNGALSGSASPLDQGGNKSRGWASGAKCTRQSQEVESFGMALAPDKRLEFDPEIVQQPRRWCLPGSQTPELIPNKHKWPTPASPSLHPQLDFKPFLSVSYLPLFHRSMNNLMWTSRVEAKGKNLSCVTLMRGVVVICRPSAE